MNGPGTPRAIGTNLHLISQRITRVVDRLESVAPDECGADGEHAPDAADRALDEAAAVRAHVRTRRLRARLLPGDLFGEPAWDILLDLYAAALEGRAVTVAEACIASAVPATAASRWLGKLAESGLIRRSGAVAGPGETVALTPQARQAVGTWVEFALLGQPLARVVAQSGDPG